MSVMMGLRIEVDVDKFKEMAAANGDTLEAVSARGREKGCLHHAFYANADGGEILVVDEWSDKESFLDFFQSTPEIPQMFADAGVQVEPHPVFGGGSEAPGTHPPYETGVQTQRRTVGEGVRWEARLGLRPVRSAGGCWALLSQVFGAGGRH